MIHISPSMGLDREIRQTLTNQRRAIEQVDRLAFRARLRAASYSRDAMAEVMAETLRALGYDLGAWEMREWTDRDADLQYTESDVDEAREDGYNEGHTDGYNAGLAEMDYDQ